ncbi:MAG TPA: outer membrane protein transport protein [Dissulfurispiraceae bacterium]|nr:outer membrane protein transport protein [Dissulfurispiraceae bacterium]
MPAKCLFYRLAVVVVSLFLLAAACNNAEASGFALIEHNVSGLGNAYAGAAATAEDASTIYFNPAGLTRVKGTQAIGAAYVIIPSAKFTNEGSSLLGGATALRGGGDNGGAVAFVPNTYVSHQVSNQVFLGLGINSPFGLKTDYSNDWVGRYHATLTDMLTINVNPSIAYKVSDTVSLGAGVSAQYIKVRYDSMIDFGSLLGSPQSFDGSVSNKGDGWGFGYNLGALFEPTDKTRLGIAYRSRVKHKLEGDAYFSGVPAPVAAGLLFKNTGIKADVTLPDTLSFSAYHKFHPQWSVMADVTWTNWSLFDEVRIRYDNPNQPDGVTTTIWKDSWRYSLGITYAPDPAWKLQAGAAFDQSPVRNPEHRTPRIPCEDRIWTAFGVSYAASKSVVLDAGYVHIFVKDPKVNLQATSTNENRLRGNLVGSFDASVNIISAQARISF